MDINRENSFSNTIGGDAIPTYGSWLDTSGQSQKFKHSRVSTNRTINSSYRIFATTMARTHSKNATKPITVPNISSCTNRKKTNRTTKNKLAQIHRKTHPGAFGPPVGWCSTSGERSKPMETTAERAETPTRTNKGKKMNEWMKKLKSTIYLLLLFLLFISEVIFFHIHYHIWYEVEEIFFVRIEFRSIINLDHCFTFYFCVKIP